MTNFRYWGTYCECTDCLPFTLQGVKGESGKSLSSKFGKNQCLYWNKLYISRKLMMSAFIWHPERGRGIIMRAWLCHRGQRVKNPLHPPKIQQNMLSRWEGVASSWYCHTLKLSFSKKPRSRAFCWCIIYFCASIGSFRILKKTGGNIFIIFAILRNCGNNLISKNFLKPFLIFWKNHC